ncbi:MAG: pilus assembly protein PilM [Armatimonadaceae bacterium]
MSLFSSLFGKEVVIGVDFGTAYIKAVQVEAHRDSFRVTRAAQQRTPQAAIRDGIIVDKDAVAAATRQMLKAAGIFATSAVIAVSGPTVQVRVVKMPRMPEAALVKSARYEASKYISSNVDESNLAFEILGAVEEDVNQMNVMLVAAPREMVDSRIDTVERAGLEAVCVDLETFALQRSVVDCNRRAFEDGALRALVDIGASHTEVCLLNGASFALTRSIPIAGDTFTDALKNQLRVDVAEAERIKMEIDLSVLLTGGDPEMVETAKSIQSVVDEMLREIRRSVNFYQSQQTDGAPQMQLTEILLAGGSSQLPGMVPYINARLGTPARVADPFESPLFDSAPEATQWLREQAPRLGIGLGLAIKEFMHAPNTGKA